jgi:2-polyprenyl-3-methyl-5-hydroxy-6-metoxy-1,4-benzoquinol methylase
MGLPGEYDYSECTACSTVFQTPIPTPAQIASFYPESYNPYKPGKDKSKNELEKAVLRTKYGYTHIESKAPDWLGHVAGLLLYKDSTPFSNHGKLLDIGCGGGKYLRSMQRLGWNVEGVEFNSSAVQTCSDMGLTVYQGELSDAAIEDCTYDVVTARHVLEHIPEPQQFIEEIFRILKPGGLMILRTPNSKALGRNWFGTNWFANDVPRHLILFSPDNLRLLAKNIGFIHKKSMTFSSPKIILNSWDYLRNNQGKPSKKRKLRRILARFYVAATALSGRGDEIFSIFKKPT